MDFFNIGRTCTKPLFDEVSGARVGQHRKHKPQVTRLRCSVLRCHQPYAKNLSTLPYTPELLRLDCCDDTPAPSLQYIFACRTPPQQWKLELRLLVVIQLPCTHSHTEAWSGLRCALWCRTGRSSSSSEGPSDDSSEQGSNDGGEGDEEEEEEEEEEDDSSENSSDSSGSEVL